MIQRSQAPLKVSANWFSVNQWRIDKIPPLPHFPNASHTGGKLTSFILRYSLQKSKLKWRINWRFSLYISLNVCLITNVNEDRKLDFLVSCTSFTTLETVELSFYRHCNFPEGEWRNSIVELRIECGFANGLKQKLKDAVDKVCKICISTYVCALSWLLVWKHWTLSLALN